MEGWSEKLVTEATRKEMVMLFAEEKHAGVEGLNGRLRKLADPREAKGNNKIGSKEIKKKMKRKNTLSYFIKIKT